MGSVMIDSECNENCLSEGLTKTCWGADSLAGFREVTRHRKEMQRDRKERDGGNLKGWKRKGS